MHRRGIRAHAKIQSYYDYAGVVLMNEIQVTLTGNMIAFWALEFAGLECQKIRDYCEEHDEAIETFFGGPSEEESVQAALEDDNWDLFSAAAVTDDFGSGGNAFIADEDLSIIVTHASDRIEIPFTHLRQANRRTVSAEDWSASRAGQRILYIFGYRSDSPSAAEFSLGRSDMFSIDRLAIAVCENQIIGTSFVASISYTHPDGAVTVDATGNDFDGEYFPAEFLQT